MEMILVRSIDSVIDIAQNLRTKDSATQYCEYSAELLYYKVYYSSQR